MNLNIRIEKIQSGRHLAVVKRVAPPSQLSTVIPQACGIVWDSLRRAGATGIGRNVAVYLDSVINLEIGVEMSSAFTSKSELVGSELPAGTVATVTHLGPYGQLAAAHRAVVDWCSAHGHRLAGPSWELYGHWVDEWNADPSKIRTDIYYLIKP